MSGRHACPYCEGTGWADPVDSETMLTDIMTAIREKGIVVLTGDYVRAAAAAELIGQTPKTLQNWRSPTVNKIPFIHRNRNVLYRLSDLAEYLARTTK